jgi:hypothetical protein
MAVSLATGGIQKNNTGSCKPWAPVASADGRWEGFENVTEREMLT